MKIIPPNRPLQPRANTQDLIRTYAYDSPADQVVVLGVRGYYRDTMGKPGVNDRGIYDDALFIYSPTVHAAFNANTDPSVIRKGIASLVPGAYRYRPGKHGISRPGGGYPAFRPATKDEELPVTRDGVVNPRPGVAINIHKGGYGTTSSEGCQTIFPDQWAAFHALLMSELSRYNQKTFPYVLVANT